MGVDGLHKRVSVLRRTSAMSSAILGPCIRISENSASEIRSLNLVLKVGHSRAKAHQATTYGRFDPQIEESKIVDPGCERHQVANLSHAFERPLVNQQLQKSLADGRRATELCTRGTDLRLNISRRTAQLCRITRAVRRGRNQRKESSSGRSEAEEDWGRWPFTEAEMLASV
jgi:hypothetical protein